MAEDTSPAQTLKIDIDEIVAGMAGRCDVKDGCIVLDRNYSISLDRCDTAEKLLAWVCHLDGHMNGRFTGLIRAFVMAAAKENGIKIDEPV